MAPIDRSNPDSTTVLMVLNIEWDDLMATIAKGLAYDDFQALACGMGLWICSAEGR
jgi:hypothetical protein